MDTRIAHRERKGERKVTELDHNTFRVPSFTSGKVYTVRLDCGGCDCPAHTLGGRRCKHVELAKAVSTCRALRFGSQIAEARVTELAHKIYSPLRSREDFVASYELLLETLSSRHATEGMKRQALRRHGRVLVMAERQAA